MPILNFFTIVAFYFSNCLKITLFPRTLLDKVGSQDETQIKLIFQSIDKNNDGQLSMQEIQDFALQLG